MAQILVPSGAVAFRSWGVPVGVCVVWLLLVATPFTRPFAAADLSDVPAGHDDSGAVIKHQDTADAAVTVPAFVDLAMFHLATEEPRALSARVVVRPVRTAILRI